MKLSIAFYFIVIILLIEISLKGYSNSVPILSWYFTFLKRLERRIFP